MSAKQAAALSTPISSQVKRHPLGAPSRIRIAKLKTQIKSHFGQSGLVSIRENGVMKTRQTCLEFDHRFVPSRASRNSDLINASPPWLKH
jgi:L,D-peptidoglycan transpeptidase YkuD (ErfK/YbiS/YcfS/YnhG family)